MIHAHARHTACTASGQASSESRDSEIVIRKGRVYRRSEEARARRYWTVMQAKGGMHDL